MPSGFPVLGNRISSPCSVLPEQCEQASRNREGSCSVVHGSHWTSHVLHEDGGRDYSDDYKGPIAQSQALDIFWLVE